MQEGANAEAFCRAHQRLGFVVVSAVRWDLTTTRSDELSAVVAVPVLQLTLKCPVRLANAFCASVRVC